MRSPYILLALAALFAILAVFTLEAIPELSNALFTSAGTSVVAFVALTLFEKKK